MPPATAPALRPRRPEGGFTLIEAVVGLAILLIATLGLVAAIVTSLKAGRVAREHAVALAAAQERMNTLLAATEPELVAIGSRQTFAVRDLTQRRDGTPVGEVRVDASQPPLYQVEVRVRWLGPYGDEALTLDSTALPR